MPYAFSWYNSSLKKDHSFFLLFNDILKEGLFFWYNSCFLINFFNHITSFQTPLFDKTHPFLIPLRLLKQLGTDLFKHLLKPRKSLHDHHLPMSENMFEMSTAPLPAHANLRNVLKLHVKVGAGGEHIYIYIFKIYIYIYIHIYTH